MWVQFQDTNRATTMFYVCVIYLPPENSTRAVNIHEFMETLMTQLYTIPQGNMFYLCGDWNSRSSGLSDSIEGIDSLPERNVIDFQTNGYGSIFCDFLIDVNCCILNGRNTVHNDFTYVSTRGYSVVDYCVIPYESLDSLNTFCITRALTVIQSLGEAGRYDLTMIVPDHSLLIWNMMLNITVNDQVNKRAGSRKIGTKTKYNTQNIPLDWLIGEKAVADINRTISHLENSEATQHNIDEMYENFVAIIKTEMNEKLPSNSS